MPYHGPHGRADAEVIPDWVLGGAARRRILERLAEPGDGWTGKLLVADLEIGPAWVYEVLRALKAIDAVERVPGSRAAYRLSQTEPVGAALRSLLEALQRYADTPVSRPPSRRSP
jgi:DNA-binding HxlR family transcriptional regulator